MTRLSALLLMVVVAFIMARVLAAAFGLDPGPMPCGVEECS